MIAEELGNVVHHTGKRRIYQKQTDKHYIDISSRVHDGYRSERNQTPTEIPGMH